MVIAYQLRPNDDDSFMLGDSTYRVPADVGYYDWRFGCDGTPHEATCPTCGSKTDPQYVNSRFRVRKRRRDMTVTYDGYTLVSVRFREFCESHGWHKDVEFQQLPGDKRFFVFKPTRVLKFDAERRQTLFEQPCPECSEHFSVCGATPIFLRDIEQPVEEGFFRTDLAFGSGHEKSPLIIVGIATAEKIKSERFRGSYLRKIEN